MRLINTETLDLIEFYDSEIPTYAILSHTWGKEEVSYREWCEKKSEKKASYSKIRKFCEICLRDGFKWAWVDTCCIDKTSSAELSEAINSMYQWYMGVTCYAYLADVPTIANFKISAEVSAFSLSRWFSRGWTLQELIAPRHVFFFTREWVNIGEKTENAQALASITGIPEALLKNRFFLYHYSVAQKMSWAAGRRTTRTEDVAYSLLGLFDVNMPLLYGEGDKAFLRLQEEIIKISNDHTIFAWAAADNLSANMTCGLLAPSPECFAGSRLFVRKAPPVKIPMKAYSMTNHGLEIELPILYDGQELQGTVTAILSCCSTDDTTKYIAIHLARVVSTKKYLITGAIKYEGDYERIICDRLDFLGPVKPLVKKIYVRRGGLLECLG